MSKLLGALVTLAALHTAALANDPCKTEGYNGRTEGTQSCQATPDGNRTITCQAGYYAIAPDVRFVTVAAGAKFAGCTKLSYCTSYGWSGHPENIKDCVDKPDGRVVSCLPGYFPYAVNGRAPTEAEMKATSIELKGNAPFLGCRAVPVASNVKMRPMSKQAALADACQRFGYSGKDANVAGCKPIDGGRIVTCMPGYVPQPNGDGLANSSITLTGDAAFPGCRVLSLCKLFGNSGSPQNVLGCTDSPNARTIRCAPGFFPVGSKTDSISLVGDKKFEGCRAKPL